MDNARSIAFVEQAGGEFEQAASAVGIATAGAAQGFEEHLHGQRRLNRRLPGAKVAEQVGEVGQVGLEQGAMDVAQGKTVGKTPERTQ